jgi:hypothetical protein
MATLFCAILAQVPEQQVKNDFEKIAQSPVGLLGFE